MAVAATPTGTTRWSRFNVSGGGTVLWLVPARPGAALDLRSDRWLDALAEGSKPRVFPPSEPEPTTCTVRDGIEVPAWSAPRGSIVSPSNAVVLEDEATARAHIAARGFVLSRAAAARLGAAFVDGWKLVALEVSGRSGTTSSPTLRVSDDGPTMLPLALTGGAAVDMKISAFVTGEGTATVPRMFDAAGPFTWGASGSDYAAQRLLAIADGSRLLREAAGQSLLFDIDSVPLPSVLGSNLPATCIDTARRAGSTRGAILGRVCAAGTLGRVPGGTACTPSTGSVPASAFVCEGEDDLALALSGLHPERVVLTRFVGIAPAQSFALDLPVTFEGDAPSSPVKRSSAYACALDAPTPSPRPIEQPPPPPPDEEYVVTHDGCSGSSTVVYVEDDSPPPTYVEDYGSSSDSCGGSSSSSSSSSSGSDGWDSDDSSSDDSSGWDSDDSSSSSSSDGCGGSSSSSSSSSGSSDDGWDTDDSSSSDSCSSTSTSSSTASVSSSLRAKGKPLHLRIPSKVASKDGVPQKSRGPSPLSRITIVAAALLLPLRRRLRSREARTASPDFRA